MTDVVKSAGRILEILEYFDGTRSDASVMDVARALNFPQSSTSGLLRSLVSLGYLRYDAHTRRYMPTHRVALLGSWIDVPYQSDGRLLKALEEIGEETSETVILGEQPGHIVRYIYIVPSRNVMRMHLVPGQIRPLFGSGMGRIFLSTYPEEKVRGLLKRVNASLKPGEAFVRYADLQEDLEEIRRIGYTTFINKVTQGGGIVTTMLPEMEGTQRMAVAIGGFAEVIRANVEPFVEVMRKAIARNLLR